jgi:hypothetical protein
VNTTADQKGNIRTKDPYYSAEFSIDGLDAAYQFRLRNTDSIPMCVLVRQDSNIVPWLKVGEVFDVKYYSVNANHSPAFLSTEIRDITRDDQGRFKGHYLVGLEILEEQ